MSKNTSSSPNSVARTSNRVESEDVEEIQKLTSYDRLPAVIATFPAVFKELEIEQRYLKLKITMQLILTTSFLQRSPRNR